MQPSTIASLTIKSLIIVQWISILVMVFALIQLFRKRIQWQLNQLVIWLIIPMAAMLSARIYESNHRPDLLKQRISQQWTWTDGQQVYRLELNAYNRTFQHQLVGDNNTSQNQMIKGSTSVFKPEVDIIAQETYYSLYLFDYPKAGYTTLISIDGASAPKISFSGKEVYELE